MARPTERRRQIVAFILAGIFPGLGQFYNRERIKGTTFLAAGVVLSWLMGRAMPMPTALSMPPPLGAGFIVPLVLLLAIWLWSIIDAWRVAGR